MVNLRPDLQLLVSVKNTCDKNIRYEQPYCKMMLKCIAIDDKPQDLHLITSYIRQTPFLDMAGAFNSARKALGMRDLDQVDLIFLDIQMTALNGIELARLLHRSLQKERVRIIFITNDDQPAAESYPTDAIDHLLKPFDQDGFLRAAHKALAYFEKEQQSDTGAGHIFVRVEYQLVRIELDDILYIEGLKDYVKIHLASSDRAVLTLMTMKALEEKLPTERFMRVKRSFIVALDKIDLITKNTISIGDTCINIGERYRPAFEEFRKRWI